MTGRDWKAGDVLVSNGVRGIATTTGAGFKVAEYVELSDGKCLGLGELPDNARLLVVIDLEDREQIERLSDLLVAQGISLHGRCDAVSTNGGVKRALRALITPPKPEEPTGLGAVVEDAKGDRWVRCRADQPGLLGVTWENERTCAHEPWPYIAAIRVLSEGVTS